MEVNKNIKMLNHVNRSSNIECLKYFHFRCAHNDILNYVHIYIFNVDFAQK